MIIDLAEKTHGDWRIARDKSVFIFASNWEALGFFVVERTRLRSVLKRMAKGPSMGKIIIILNELDDLAVRLNSERCKNGQGAGFSMGNPLGGQIQFFLPPAFRHWNAHAEL